VMILRGLVIYGCITSVSEAKSADCPVCVLSGAGTSSQYGGLWLQVVAHNEGVV